MRDREGQDLRSKWDLSAYLLSTPYTYTSLLLGSPEVLCLFSLLAGSHGLVIPVAELLTNITLEGSSPAKLTWNKNRSLNGSFLREDRMFIFTTRKWMKLQGVLCPFSFSVQVLLFFPIHMRSTQRGLLLLAYCFSRISKTITGQSKFEVSGWEFQYVDVLCRGDWKTVVWVVSGKDSTGVKNSVLRTWPIRQKDWALSNFE